MEYLELILKNVEIKHIYSLLLLTKIIDKDNIKDSHFYIDNQDYKYYEDLNFYDYYLESATGMIKSGYADIGVRVYDVVTIISGSESIVEVVMNFKRVETYEMTKILEWMKLNIKFASHMILGIEPVETVEEIIFIIEKS